MNVWIARHRSAGCSLGDEMAGVWNLPCGEFRQARQSQGAALGARIAQVVARVPGEGAVEVKASGERLTGGVPLDEQLRQSRDCVEGEVPDIGVADHIVPRIQSWDDHVDDHDARNILVPTHVGVSDHPADVVTDEDRAFEIELLD